MIPAPPSHTDPRSMRHVPPRTSDIPAPFPEQTYTFPFRWHVSSLVSPPTANFAPWHPAGALPELPPGPALSPASPRGTRR